MAESEEMLSFRLSGQIEVARIRPVVVTVVGEKDIALPIARFLGLEWPPQADGFPGRMVLVQPERIEFLEGDKAWIRLII